ncbi:MAG: hypothetical protein V9E94_06825 [Microthrixaceae bacterium]
MGAPGDGADAEQRLLEVGRITKAHGLRGEVVVWLSSDRTERLAPGSVFHTGSGILEGPIVVCAPGPMGGPVRRHRRSGGCRAGARPRPVGQSRSTTPRRSGCTS